MNPNADNMMMNANFSNSVKYKTMLCRHFKNGNCTLSDKCHFAHGIQELRNFSDPLPTKVPLQQPKISVSNFKTVRCRYYDNGYCKNGPQCSFAHGDVDVKQPGVSIGGQPLMGSNYSNPAMDPNIQILIMILQNLEQVFPNDQSIILNLRQAQEYARYGDSKSASNIIISIINDPQRSAEEKRNYQTIYTNAQIYYNTHMQTLAAQNFQRDQPMQSPVIAGMSNQYNQQQFPQQQAQQQSFNYQQGQQFNQQSLQLQGLQSPPPQGQNSQQQQSQQAFSSPSPQFSNNNYAQQLQNQITQTILQNPSLSTQNTQNQPQQNEFQNFQNSVPNNNGNMNNFQ